ncbi:MULTISPECIES: aminotransferase class V-fold PLP-dependent enzyme [unclassified Marinovum]
MFSDSLLTQIRARFAHVDSCPFQGPRTFFENAGGALTLNSVVETSTRFAAIPDNQGRDNPAAKALGDIIAQSKSDMADFFGATSGQFFVGESGTELTFRLIRAMILGAQSGPVIGSTVEHPASRSAAHKWAHVSGRDYISVPHDNAQGLVTPEAYAAQITADTAVATILHTSPVTGMAMDLPGIVAAIRAKSPDCLIFVDGIQHASHGRIDIDGYDIDGYVISPYKVFSRHGYGIAWVSDRVSKLRLEGLMGGPEENWEMGTRDTGAYATFSDVVAYFDWLGGEVSSETDRRARILAAGNVIHDHETALTNMMLHGHGNLSGLSELPGVHIVGGTDNPAREGLVSFWLDTMPSEQVVAHLNASGIRTHTRKADHYSGNILDPLDQPSCIRVSMCHYNSPAEIAGFLAAMKDIA